MSAAATAAAQNALESAKRMVFGRKLSPEQVKLVCNQEIKKRTKWVLFVAAFIDLSGAVLLLGGGPLMCANAPGAILGSVPGAFPASDFAGMRSDAPPAMDFALAVNLIYVSNKFGGVFSNYIAGVMSDRFGRKIVIQGCLLGGVLSFLLMFIAGFWARSYWMFLAANFVNGLFSGIRGVISAYLQDIHDPMEFMKDVMPTMINFFLFGAMGGSILAMVWVAIVNSDPSNENSTIALFGPALVGCVLSIAAVWMVHVYCPEPARKEASKAAGDKPPPPPLSKEKKLIIAIILIAGSLDTFGDTGNRFARNTILTNRYPAAQPAVVQYVLMASNIVSIFIAQRLIKRTILKKGFMPGTSLWLILGNVASAVVQFALLVIIRYDSNKEAMALYIVVWLLSQVFGVCSTLAAMFLFPAFVPPHQKGKYMGVRNSLTSAVECAAPVMLALIYQTGSLATGDDRAAQLDLWSNVCLAVCGTISALAFVGYLPVPRLLPKPPPKAAGASKPTDPLKVAPASDAARKPLSHYDNVGWQEWTSLSTNERYEIRQARVREGMPPPYFVWGTWDDDMPLASELLAKAPSEMGEIRAKYTEVVTDDAKLADLFEMRANFLAASEENKAKREASRAAMGQWIADYLDDAGYEQWEAAPHLFKAMIMNAFPPIDILDGKRPDIKDRAQLRTSLMALMKVLDLHVTTAQTTSTVDLTDAVAIGKLHTA